MVDGKVQVSGQTAVMAINETQILQMMMAQNPELVRVAGIISVARLLSRPAAPLGPLMELNAQGDFNESGAVAIGGLLAVRDANVDGRARDKRFGIYVEGLLA